MPTTIARSTTRGDGGRVQAVEYCAEVDLKFIEAVLAGNTSVSGSTTARYNRTGSEKERDDG